MSSWVIMSQPSIDQASRPLFEFLHMFQFCRNWDNGFLATTPKTIFKVCFQLSLWNNRWCQHYKRGRGMFVTLMARLLQTGCCASFLLLLVGGRNAYQAPVPLSPSCSCSLEFTWLFFTTCLTFLHCVFSTVLLLQTGLIILFLLL